MNEPIIRLEMDQRSTVSILISSEIILGETIGSAQRTQTNLEEVVEVFE